MTKVVTSPATKSLSAVFLSLQTARLTVQRNSSGNQGIIRCRKQTTKTEIETILLFLRAHQSHNVKNAEEK